MRAKPTLLRLLASIALWSSPIRADAMSDADAIALQDPAGQWRATVTSNGFQRFELLGQGVTTSVPFHAGGLAGPALELVDTDSTRTIPLRPARRERVAFEGSIDSFAISLRYEVAGPRLALIVMIRNTATNAAPTPPVRLRLGIDISADPPSGFCPTLLRTEPTHAWGYLTAPAGRRLGITSPDPIGAFEMETDSSDPRQRTLALRLSSAPAAHVIAAAGSRIWTIYLEELNDPDTIFATLSKSCRGPVVTASRTFVGPGELAELQVRGRQPVRAILTTPEGRIQPFNLQRLSDTEWRSAIQMDVPPGAYPVRITDEAKRESVTTLHVRHPWSWYLPQAAAADFAPAPIPDTPAHFARWAQLALQQTNGDARQTLGDQALEREARERYRDASRDRDPTSIRGLWYLYRLTGREEFLARSHHALAELLGDYGEADPHLAAHPGLLDALREVALRVCHVVEREDHTYVTYNGKSRRDNQTLIIEPAEGGVEFIHVNLRAPAKIRARIGETWVEKRLEKTGWLERAP